MPEYDNTNSGALFRNDKKETDRQPDYRGQVNADGTDYWVSAWIKEGKKDGRKYMSLALTPKDEQPQRSEAQATQVIDDDDIPF